MYGIKHQKNSKKQNHWLQQGKKLENTANRYQSERRRQDGRGKQNGNRNFKQTWNNFEETILKTILRNFGQFKGILVDNEN